MTEPDSALFNRLRDLQRSLGDDLDWLICHRHRSDGLHDLGERLRDLGAELIRSANELNAAVLAKLPVDKWLPEAATRPGKIRDAHYVGEWPIRCGPIYLAVCGAACFPFYGRDPAHRIVRHPPCKAYEGWAGSPRGESHV